MSSGEPADPMERITEASVISSTEGPIYSDKVRRRTGYPYPPGLLQEIGTRIKDSGSGKREGLPKPRDNVVFLKALAARAGLAMRHLHGKIATIQVKPRGLDERVQGLVHEIQGIWQEVVDGKQLDAERLIVFEEIIITVKNVTWARQDEITRLAQELDHAGKQQQEANEQQSRHEVISSQLHANIMAQGETSANRASALKQEAINLRAQHTGDVATLQRVVDRQAEDQGEIMEELSVQMAIILQRFGQSPTNPDHYDPGLTADPSSSGPANCNKPWSSTTMGARETGAKRKRPRQARQRKATRWRTTKTRKSGMWKRRTPSPSQRQWPRS